MLVVVRSAESADDANSYPSAAWQAGKEAGNTILWWYWWITNVVSHHWCGKGGIIGDFMTLVYNIW